MNSINQKAGGQKKMKKVLIGGFWDLLHSGHILSLLAAKKFGGYLIVHVASDRRVKEKKGAERPIQSQAERMFIVSNIIGVNNVWCYEGLPGQSLAEYVIGYISEVQPDVFVISLNPETSEDGRQIRDFCGQKGIRFEYLPEIEGVDKLHTTGIIERIKKLK